MCSIWEARLRHPVGGLGAETFDQAKLDPAGHSYDNGVSPRSVSQPREIRYTTYARGFISFLGEEAISRA
jgi:hypothetical protein